MQQTSVFSKNTLAGALILFLVVGFIEGRISQGINESQQESYRKVVESQLININASLEKLNSGNVKIHDLTSARLQKLEHTIISWEDEIAYIDAYRKTGDWQDAEAKVLGHKRHK